MDAESLAKELLAADLAILRVLVLDKNGRILARIYSEMYPEKATLGPKTEQKFGQMDMLTIAMFEQAEHNYGTIDFILLAFKNAKIMLIRNEKQSFNVALRIVRSANAEYLHSKLESILSKS